MSQTIYTLCNPIAEDCALFQNSGRTIPANQGVYWDGTNCWEVGFGGIVTAQGVCTTTTTSTTTTTTTSTVPTGFYYTATQVLCGNCPNGTNITVYSPISLTEGFYYNIGDGYVYKILSSTSGPSFDVDLTGAASGGTNCNAACIG
jgi:hypothetical protein